VLADPGDEDWAGRGDIPISAFVELWNNTGQTLNLSWARLVVSDTASLITYTIPYSTYIDDQEFLPLYSADSYLPLVVDWGDVRLYTWEWSPTFITVRMVMTDTVTLPGATPGASYGRVNDGAATWGWMYPNPGYTNTHPSPTPTRTPTRTPTATATGAP
jgi:hypothetical protein